MPQPVDNRATKGGKIVTKLCEDVVANQIHAKTDIRKHVQHVVGYWQWWQGKVGRLVLFVFSLSW